MGSNFAAGGCRLVSAGALCALAVLGGASRVRADSRPPRPAGDECDAPAAGGVRVEITTTSQEQILDRRKLKAEVTNCLDGRARVTLTGKSRIGGQSKRIVKPRRGTPPGSAQGGGPAPQQARQAPPRPLRRPGPDRPRPQRDRLPRRQGDDGQGPRRRGARNRLRCLQPAAGLAARLRDHPGLGRDPHQRHPARAERDRHRHRRGAGGALRLRQRQRVRPRARLPVGRAASPPRALPAPGSAS